MPACAELAFSVVAVSVRTREEQRQRQTHEQHKSGHKAATPQEEVEEEDARGTPEAQADRLAAKFLLCAVRMKSE